MIKAETIFYAIHIEIKLSACIFQEKKEEQKNSKGHLKSISELLIYGVILETVKKLGLHAKPHLLEVRREHPLLPSIQ